MVENTGSARSAGPARPGRRPLRQSPGLKALASLKLAVALMACIAAAMAVATVYEARHTRIEAQRYFYQSWWFGVLLGALAFNICAATIIRWPFPLRRIGFPITHLGILVILGGALATNRMGVEGQLRLAEASASDRVSLPSLVVGVEPPVDAGAAPADVDLPMDPLRPRRGLGTEATVGDSGVRLTFREFLPNARWVRGRDGSLTAVAAPRDDDHAEHPALRVEASTGGESRSVWLGWERPTPVALAGRTYRLTLRNRELPLPFAVRLDRFERETYPGTNQAAMFTSRVTLRGEGIDGERGATITMNRPLRIGGYTFFQSGFQNDGRRMTSILTVSRDPGKWPVYCGFALVCVGVVLMVLLKRRGAATATRADDRRSSSGERVACAA